MPITLSRLRAAVIVCVAGFLAAYSVQAADKPNIIYVLCDDLGYGDVKCLNPGGKIKTPHLDRLAAGGMIFTDAHSGSAVCTPTRYGIITGRYSWRTRLQSGVLGGLSPRLIEPGRLTVAELLKKNGYHTAAIGKWHLGMDWVKLPGKDVAENSVETPEQVNNVDFTKPIKNGPTAVGFDYYFGISASLDMVPYTYIQNDRVTKQPTENRDFVMMTGRDTPRSRLGPAAPGFTAEEVLPTFTRKTVEHIGQRASDAKRGKPFFLYLPINSPHTPITPTKEWLGKSGISPYADFVMQTDWSIGQIMNALDRHGLVENTLFIVTSDNGSSPQAKPEELEAIGHFSNFPFRGGKADIYDGGHRVPFIVRWPAKVKAGVKSEQITCLSDFMATAADIVGAKLPPNAAEDSVSILPALLGQDKAPLREAIVHHSINGSFSIRQGNWKLELCPGSGGWSAPRPNVNDTSKLPLIQLYDLATDIGEKNNVQAQHPEIVARLTKLLEKYVADGRSTPGKPQKNTVDANIWKAGKAAHQPLAAKKQNQKAKKQ